MSTYETSPDQSIAVGNIAFAYRQFGQTQGIPLLLIMGFRGTMDQWDPALINPLAVRRPIIMIEGAGVGRSQGDIPKTFGAWTEHYVSVLRALGLQHVDVMGYSMGGCVAQLLALDYPDVVRRLILCGTTPSSGEGVTRAPVGPFNLLKTAETPQEHKAAFLAGFFAPSERSQAAGAAAWDRMAHARPNKAKYVPQAGAHRQAIAFAKFIDPKQADNATFNRLHEIQLPILIANGSDDQLIPTANSVVMWKKLRHADAHLHLFPDSGHGFLNQYATQFAALINDFLDENPKLHSRL